MEATASGIEALADSGVAAHESLVREGVPGRIRADRDWVEKHVEELNAALG